MINSSKTKPPRKRQYPPVYEKAPIVLGIVTYAIVLLLLIVFGVAFGLFPGAGLSPTRVIS